MQLLSCDLWLMELSAMQAFASLASSNISADLQEIRASAPQQSRQKSIGIIPITGPLEARTTLMGEMLGMSSYERIGQIFDHFLNDETVSGIILDVASPGGMVYGCEELAEKIFQARGRKPIIAVANPLAASGAFWIAAAADRLVVTPSGDVGSVGVIAKHIDVSQANEREGAKVTVVRSTGAPFKGEHNDAEPLTTEARNAIQSDMDTIHARFVGALARYRGVPVEQVAEHFGKGRLVNAKAAVAAGMADRVGTFQEIGEKMLAGRVRIASAKVEDDWNMPTRREMLRERAESIKAIAGEVVSQ